MLGRFLEISAACEDIPRALEFYRQLGFRQASVGEAWRHPYAVVSDGSICVGLHKREPQRPALTFVRRDLGLWLAPLEERGLTVESARLDDGGFNHALLSSAAGVDVCLVEARTFSPLPAGDGADILGSALGVALPGSAAGIREHWLTLGFSEGRDQETGLLCAPGLRLALHDRPRPAGPALYYRAPDMNHRLEFLAAKGLDVTRLDAGLALLACPGAPPLLLADGAGPGAVESVEI